MQETEYKISPPWAVIAILIFCIIASFILMMLGFESHSPRTAPPEFLLLISILALCSEFKTIYLQTSTIRLQYHLVFLSREISLDCINGVEIVKKRDNRYILIALDSCPLFSKDKYKRVENYILMHPFKVVAIRCWDTKKQEWESYFEHKTRVENID